MFSVSLVSTKEELKQIHQLNQQNLKHQLTGEEKMQEGFVTWLYSLDLLEQMHGLAPSIIVKDGNKVIGYALTTLKEARSFHPDLQAFIQHIQPLYYNEQPLSAYSYYCMGQVCIAKGYRGQGVFQLLYQKHKEAYNKQYSMLITEISTANIRSQRAHEKVGFKTIHTHHDALDEWNVVVWDWREKE
jgi:RimJ/RimL family protein N-acetyltransferase